MGRENEDKYNFINQNINPIGFLADCQWLYPLIYLNSKFGISREKQKHNSKIHARLKKNQKTLNQTTHPSTTT